MTRAPHASHYSQTTIPNTGVVTLVVATSFCSVNKVLNVKHSTDANLRRSGVIDVCVIFFGDGKYSLRLAPLTAVMRRISYTIHRGLHDAWCNYPRALPRKLGQGGMSSRDLYGTRPSAFSSSELTGTELVEDLQELIKSKKSRLHDVDTDTIIVMKVLCDINLESECGHLEILDHEVRIYLSEVFKTQPKRNHLYVVIDAPENVVTRLVILDNELRSPYLRDFLDETPQNVNPMPRC
ncbi:uncharacterized protein BJ212DRAFT_1483201 [Suillus subaureus]|uniref:Uncharacterized protein n=1 Tax=Suillus subaureus TaxID=48587 RepID=A0A9P7E6M7_9AGAM|nr:uncharacterized protein BJ212DRAFT_1483201 [Suillus subaureus]KAG1812596.1 hypothetical protein BJ212DRAFT_1483201 [Suillus subaureus]